MARKKLFICDLLQRREIGSLHRNEIHQLTEASTGLADKLLVHNNVIKVMIICPIGIHTLFGSQQQQKKNRLNNGKL